MKFERKLIAFCFLIGAPVLRAATLSDADRKHLDQPTIIQGYSCGRGYAWFYADGRLRRCKLSRETAVGDVTTPADSLIELRPDGTPLRVMATRPLQLGTILCEGGGPLGASEGSVIELYPSGKLHLCFLHGDQQVDGIPCASGGIVKATSGREHPVMLDEKGRLTSCGLSRDFKNQHKGEKFQIEP